MPKIQTSSDKLCKVLGPGQLEVLIKLYPSIFGQEENELLTKVGFEFDEGVAFRTVESTTTAVRKILINADAVFVVSTISAISGDTTSLKALPSLDSITLPDHVRAFVEAVCREDNGWGRGGNDGLMYRGHNVFDIYTGRIFQERVEDAIKNDEELRDMDKCDDCSMIKLLRRNSCSTFTGDREALRLLYEECKDKNRKKPEEITCQEVYLGYNSLSDTFVTAWDVFGSDNAGCVILEFKIDEEGRAINPNGYVSDPFEVCDGHPGKFYVHNPGKRSMYEAIVASGNVISIRLD